MSSLGPTLPYLAANTRATVGEISILFTARSLGSLVSSMWGGRMYDTLRGHRVMAFVLVAIAACTALTPGVPALWLLATLLFITGIAQGVLNIGGNALLVWVHGRSVGPFMNGLHFFFGVGTFITPVIIAQVITRNNGLVWTYLLLAAIILPMAAVIFFPSPQAPQPQAGTSAGKDNVRLIVLLTLIFACYGGASNAYGGWIFTYVTQSHIADATNAAYLNSLFWGALTVGRLVAIPVAMRWKPGVILRADFLGALVSLLALLLWPGSIIAVIVTSAGLGFALASIFPTTMSLAGQLMTISGRVTGYFSIGSSAGAMLIPWLIGQFFEIRGPRSMPVILLVDMVLALGVLIMLARHPSQD